MGAEVLLGHDVMDPPPDAPRAVIAPRPTSASLARSLREWVAENGVVPLSWAATSPAKPHPNLGDALSAVITAAMAGLPVQRRKFSERNERLVAPASRLPRTRRLPNLQSFSGA